jgi:dienelactone hydrolase
MAGNAREWCLNETGGLRFMLGGGWNDPYYVTTNPSYAQPPLDRSPSNGIRLVSYLENEGLEAARLPIAREPAPDFTSIPPLSDDVFEVYRRQFAYDGTPLEAVVERADSATHWIRERITFDAAYGDERMVLYLYVPRDREPPFQTVVYFPGSGALNQQSVDEWRTIHLDFALRSGRAVAFPVFKGTFERDSELRVTDDAPTILYRDHMIQWVKDLSRSIDYLETRADLNTDRLAYYGYSWGGRVASIMLAVEPRFDAAVLYVAGYNTQRALPEADVVLYTPRVTTPVLMLNGRYDDVFPLETHAVPMFERLGTPTEHKRHVISDGGHFVPRTQLITETLDWLDRYLGPTS